MNIANCRSRAFLIAACCFFEMNKCLAQDLFTLLRPDQTGIRFVNHIVETKDFNVLNYEYIYNGAGVGIGDLNNDGLSDIVFSANMVENGIYINQGNLQFKDISKTAFTNPTFGFQTGVTLIDVNQDGWLDIYLSKSVSGGENDRRHQLYINNKNLTFTDRANEFGLDDKSYTMQAYFRDFDHDGDIDLFLLNHPSAIGQAKKITLGYNDKKELEAIFPKERAHVSNRYYENIKGKFVDKTSESGLESYAFGLSAVLADFNGDHHCDIYVSNDYTRPNFLYINNGKGKFTDSTSAYFKHFAYNSMGSDYADIDNDGYDDLMTVDMLPEGNYRQKQFRQQMSYDQYDKLVKYKLGSQLVKNVLDWNQKGKGYSDIAHMLDMSNTDWSWAPLMADFDNNGHKDIYITNGYYRDLTDQDIAKYVIDSVVKKINAQEAGKDISNLLSLFPSAKASNYFYANNGQLKFSKNPPSAGLYYPSFSNGAAYADLDNDGDLEIVVNNLNQEAFIFKNNSIEHKFGNFIRFKLKSSRYGEASTYGSEVIVRTSPADFQSIKYYPTKGFLSCHEKFVHFGLGTHTQAEVSIRKPNGKLKNLGTLNVNMLHEIDIDQIQDAIEDPVSKSKPLFQDITDEIGLNVQHIENEFNDFKQEPLLPHKFSNSGPKIAVADVNKDGLEDFILGGSTETATSIYLQASSGRFTQKKIEVFEQDKVYEDGDIQCFDFDKDGDLDIMISSAGNEYKDDKSKYEVRLYIQDGNLNFQRANADIMPSVQTSSNVIAVSDYNHDGFPDIFIGGKVVPGRYGMRPKSVLMMNENGKFRFEYNVDVSKLGMITDALWMDYDENGWEDLILVGYWMNPTIYFNRNGILEKDPKFITELSGWWTKIHAIDLDQNGKKDLILGNYGMNHRYHATKQKPLYLMVNDFDQNGSTDAVISYTQDQYVYPIHTRDILLDQIPMLKKKFNRYEKYSKAQSSELFDSIQMRGTNFYTINSTASYVMYNQGLGSFQVKRLPKEAQTFPILTINSYDIDQDGDLDLMLSGNDHGMEIESGPIDAGNGLLLENKGKMDWVPYDSNTGYVTPDDTKSIVPIRIKGKAAFLIGASNKKLKVVQLLKQ